MERLELEVKDLRATTTGPAWDKYHDAIARAEKAERERDEALRRIASVLDLQLPTNDPVRAIELDIKRLLDTAERWSQACALALEHCPVGDGESHIRQGIPRLAKKCAEAIAERDTALAEVRRLEFMRE